MDIKPERLKETPRQPPSHNRPQETVLRGRGLADPKTVQEHFDEAAFDQLSVPLLSVAIPHKSAYNHIVFFGATNSGKTTCLNQPLRVSLKLVGRGFGHRVFIYDYKRSARSYLESMKIRGPVYFLDPADVRTHGIDWARELDTPFAALEFVKLVVLRGSESGNNSEKDRVFTANARSALYIVIRTFQLLAPGQWDLKDLVDACSSQRNMWRVLRQTAKGREMRRIVFGASGKGSKELLPQGSGVFFTLNEFATNFSPIASAMRDVPPERRITLDDFLKQEAVLVLGHYEKYAESLAPFQNWVFGALAKRLLSGPDVGHDSRERTSFFLDEVRNAPFVKDSLMTKLANSGRSKGAALVAGVVSVAGLRSVMTDAEAEEFLEMFGTKVFLRLDGNSATWAERYFGKHLRVVRKDSEGTSVATALGMNRSRSVVNPDRDDEGATEQVTTTPQRGVAYEATDRTTVYQSDFQNLPAPQKEGGDGLVVRAYVSVQEWAWKEEATGFEKVTINIRKGHEKSGDIQLWRGNDSELDDLDWDAETLERLGLDKRTKSATPSSPPAAAPTAPSEPSDEPESPTVFELAFGPAPCDTSRQELDEEMGDDSNLNSGIGVFLDDADGRGYQPVNGYE